MLPPIESLKTANERTDQIDAADAFEAAAEILGRQSHRDVVEVLDRDLAPLDHGANLVLAPARRPHRGYRAAEPRRQLRGPTPGGKVSRETFRRLGRWRIAPSSPHSGRPHTGPPRPTGGCREKGGRGGCAGPRHGTSTGNTCARRDRTGRRDGPGGPSSGSGATAPHAERATSGSPANCRPSPPRNEPRRSGCP